ncbi:MAG: hypothetical protein ACP5D7_13415 [Limnospira sp.]
MSQERPTPPQPRPVKRRRRSARRSRGRLFRDAAIALLRQLIKTLEGTVERLEAESQIPTRRGLSGWVWGVIALAVAFGFVAVFFPNSAPEEMAQRPPVEEIRPAIPTPEPEISELPEVEEPISKPPEMTEIPIAAEPESESEKPGVEAPEIIEIEESLAAPEPGNLPPELTAPNDPKPVNLIASVAIARPYLSDSIRDRLAEFSDRYGDDLIQAVEANFVASLLQVEVGDEWYELDDKNQNRWANQLFQKVRSLDFTRLEIRDNDGQIIARNPVVGSEMIIFKR